MHALVFRGDYHVIRAILRGVLAMLALSVGARVSLARRDPRLQWFTHGFT